VVLVVQERGANLKALTATLATPLTLALKAARDNEVVEWAELFDFEVT
jgi:hypothetical protein